MQMWSFIILGAEEEREKQVFIFYYVLTLFLETQKE